MLESSQIPPELANELRQRISEIHLVLESIPPEEGLAALAGDGVEVVAERPVAANSADLVGLPRRLFIVHCS